MIDKKGQVTDDENAAASDPNLVGPQATQAVQNRTAGMMTPCSEYDQTSSDHGARKYKEIL